MYVAIHAVFISNFILKNISCKCIFKDGKWYNYEKKADKVVKNITDKYFLEFSEFKKTFTKLKKEDEL